MLVQPVDRIRCYFSYFRLHKQHGATGRVATVLNFSYFRDTYEKFFEGGAGGGDWQLLSFVLWCGFFFSLSFQSFVLSHLVFAPVRMIPVAGIIVRFWETTYLPLP